MAVKKTSVKATRAKKTAPKKTIAKTSAAAKKAAPAKKPTVPAARKSTPAKPVKAAPKSPAKVSATTSVTPPKPATAIASEATEITATAELNTAAESGLPESKAEPLSARSASLRNTAVDTDDSDESDPDMATNLLAGPRNVKPYIPRRGEQYMSKEQLEHFRNILENWKRDLMQEVDRTVLHMKDEAANFPDPNDRATQESEFSLELRTRDRERKLIRKIEEAIKRIDDGTYGYCVETGEEIGIKRLEARPVATLCVEAQERRERREKQYGDRDDRYR
jgi:DnaK suppressor protein